MSNVHSINNENKEVNILHVIKSLDYLKRASEKEGYEDIAEIIESSFRICLTIYMHLWKEPLASQMLKDYETNLD